MPVKLIDPPISALEASPQPLTAGEWAVLNYFATHLGQSWEIYVQPHLNGLRPDFVLLNPRVGIVVVEVKDWNLSAMDYQYSTDQHGIPKLWGTLNGERIFLGRSDPVSKIDVYKNSIFEIFCPRLKDDGGYATIIGVIAFPFARRDEIEAILQPARAHRGHLTHPRQNTLLTLNEIALGEKGVSRAIPVAHLRENLRFSAIDADDLRHWLVEPEFSREQRIPLGQELDHKQQSLVTSRPETRFRKIRGAAGSGKSLVLAGRAALLASQGKRVLLITYNITLINYLRDYLVRFDRAKDVRSNIEAWNFHIWCKRIADLSGHLDDYFQLWNDNSPTEVMEAVLAQETEKWCAELEPADRYDAILVDEGQDFQLKWWLALRSALKPAGEMLLAVDRTQNIYGVDNWIDDDLRGSGLSSRWVELSISYRMPEALIDLASRFIRDYLPGNDVVFPMQRNRELELTPERLQWIQCTKLDATQACYTALANMLHSSDPPLSVADLTFITDDTQVGFSLMSMLREKLNIHCIHTLEEQRDNPESTLSGSSSRRKKLAFFKGDGRVKVTTIHSFKGWESRALVIFVSRAKTRDDLALVYAGITRLKRADLGSHLTVVSCASQLAPFGVLWPQFCNYETLKRAANLPLPAGEPANVQPPI
jgi:hypothetical protein